MKIISLLLAALVSIPALAQTISGPSSSTVDTVPRFRNTSGKSLDGSLVRVNAAGDLDWVSGDGRLRLNAMSTATRDSRAGAEGMLIYNTTTLTAQIFQGGVWTDWGTGGGGGANTLHNNVAGEIVAIADKATPVSADHLLIEDSASGNAKKDITIGSLESALEGFLDLQDLQGQATLSQVPHAGWADTATTATNALGAGSASAFFTSGAIPRNRGGTGADTSAFGAGILGSDGSNNTIDIDTEAELETALGGINLLSSGEVDTANEFFGIMTEFTGTGSAVRSVGPTITGTANVAILRSDTIINTNGISSGTITASGAIIANGSVNLVTELNLKRDISNHDDFSNLAAGTNSVNLVASNLQISSGNLNTITNMGGSTNTVYDWNGPGKANWGPLTNINNTMTQVNVPTNAALGKKIMFDIIASGGPYSIFLPTSWTNNTQTPFTTIGLDQRATITAWWTGSEVKYSYETAQTDPLPLIYGGSQTALTDPNVDAVQMWWEAQNKMVLAAIPAGSYNSNNNTLNLGGFTISGTGNTTNSTSNLFTYAMATGTTWHAWALFTGGGRTNQGAYQREILITRDTGSSSIVGSNNVSTIESTAGMEANFFLSGNTVNATVTGVSGEAIAWDVRGHYIVTQNPPPSGGGSAFVLDEGFETNPGYDNANWKTNTGFGTGTATVNADYTTSPPEGSQWLVLTGDDKDIAITNKFTSGTTTWVRWIWKWTADTSSALSGVTLSTNGSTLARVRLFGNGTQFAANVSHGGASSTTSYGTLAKGTVYYNWLMYQKGSGANGVISWYFATSPTRPGSPTVTFSTGTSTSDVNTIALEKEEMDYYYDGVRVRNDGTSIDN